MTALWTILLALGGSVTETAGSPGLVCPIWEDDGPINPLYYEEDRKCYVLTSIKCTWSCAKRVCERNSAMLTKVNSSTILDHIQHALRSYAKHRFLITSAEICFFVGANDRNEEGHLVWTDGDPVKHDVWELRSDNNEPGKDCVKMCARQSFSFTSVLISSIYWARANCDDHNIVMCQYDKTPVLFQGPTSETDVKQNGIEVSDTWICPTWTSTDIGDPFYHQEGHTCYIIFGQPKDFDEALEVCKRNDAMLVKVNSPKVFDHFKNVFAKFYRNKDLNKETTVCLMIGANDRNEEGTWVWTDGEPVPKDEWQQGTGWLGPITDLMFDCAGICAKNGHVTSDEDIYLKSFTCDYKRFTCQYDAVTKVVPVKNPSEEAIPVPPPTAHTPTVAVLTLLHDLTGYILLDRPDWSDTVITPTQCGRKCQLERCQIFQLCQKTNEVCTGYNKMPPMPLNLVRAPGCRAWEFKLV